MINRIFLVLCVVAVVFGAALGNMEAVATAALDGAAAAVQLTISLCGMMCLWSGICRVLQDAGAVRHLSVLFRPMLRFLFPDVLPDSEAGQAITANISANMLGIGNAATPLGMRAMNALAAESGECEGREDDMIALAVINTAPVSVIPGTILALRRSAGSVRPFCIVAPIWICSLCGALLVAVLLRCFRQRARETRRETKQGRRRGTRQGVSPKVASFTRKNFRV